MNTSSPYGPVHTAGNAIPPLDADPDLAYALDQIRGIDAGLDQIADGIHLLALTRHTPSTTQTILATLTADHGADVLTALALLVQRLTDADTNPSLRALPLTTQKTVQQRGEQYARETAGYAPRQSIAEAISLIDQEN